LYHYLHWYRGETGNLDIEELLLTEDGISYTMPDDWDIIGYNYLDLTDAYIVGRYVSITFENVFESVKCAVIKVSDKSNMGSSTVGVAETEANITVEYSASTNIFARCRMAGYKPYSTMVTLGSTGNTITVQMIADPFYT